jgi:hypothetical protein
MTATELRVNEINVRLTNLENEVLRKAKPLDGYNPYRLGGSNLSANVWIYDITPIDDRDIRWYYAQFNNINGSATGTTDWMPLPRAFINYGYALHPDFHTTFNGFPTLPVVYSGAGRSYKVEIQDTEINVRLHNWASATSTISNDMVGVVLMGNAPVFSEKSVEEMSTEELVKLAKELQVKVKGYEQT